MSSAEFGREHIEKLLDDYRILNKSKNKIKFNKEKLYLAFAMLSLRMGDEINTLIYWELANKEYEFTQKTPPNVDIFIDDLKDRFQTLYNPARDAYVKNVFINKQNNNNKNIMAFDDLIKSFNPINANAYHFLSNAIKNNKIQYRLRNYPDSEIIRIYSQEFITSLSILSESVLKQKFEITSKDNRTYGQICADTLPNENEDISNYYNSIVDCIKNLPAKRFDDYFPQLIKDIESKPLSDTQFKAYVICGGRLIRDQVLHQYDSKLKYYNDQSLFEKTIGLLFANISAIQSLKSKCKKEEPKKQIE